MLFSRRLDGFQMEKRLVETTYTFIGTPSHDDIDRAAAFGRELLWMRRQGRRHCGCEFPSGLGTAVTTGCFGSHWDGSEPRVDGGNREEQP